MYEADRLRKLFQLLSTQKSKVSANSRIFLQEHFFVRDVSNIFVHVIAPKIAQIFRAITDHVKLLPSPSFPRD